jgi:hypothetical protein
MRLIKTKPPALGARPYKYQTSKHGLTTQIRCAIQREKWEGWTDSELAEKYGIPEWLVATYPAWSGEL